MEQYIGTKVINAKPMILSDYNTLQSITQENNSIKLLTKDYLVEYTDGGIPNHKDFKGYISWSPKEVFDRAYKASGNLSFGDAITYMKLGYKVARKGWNGKGMWISISRGSGEPLEAEHFWNPHAKQSAVDNGGSMEVLPLIIMKTADSKILMGWLASQSDMLADDWELL